MEDDADLLRIEALLAEGPEDYEAWAKLIATAEGLDGGLHRNSSPQHINAARNVYDQFLAKFPLFFGYWKKYADLEFNIAGSEAAEVVYERGVASIPISVDLWVNYCEFKLKTSHDTEVTRELFERGANTVGLDFMSHPFWDSYLNFEEQAQAHDKVIAILQRLLPLPLHQYARYYERYRRVAASQPVDKLADPERIKQLRSECKMYEPDKDSSQVDKAVQARLEQIDAEVFQQAQTETGKRWPFESEIKRPYFHVTELDEAQTANWSAYLDFEEAEGNHERIAFLYERCLVACAYYDEFWLRYARWMNSQFNKAEESRNIYIRASCYFAPIARPDIRLHWALFEEAEGRFSIALDIYSAILMNLPSHLPTIDAWTTAVRRQQGNDAAVELCSAWLKDSNIDKTAKSGIMLSIGRLQTRETLADMSGARQVFQSNIEEFQDIAAFWHAWLTFEIELPPSAITAAAEQEHNSKQNGEYTQKSSAAAHITAVWEALHARKGSLAKYELRNVGERYLRALLDRGELKSAKDYIILDAEIHS